MGKFERMVENDRMKRDQNVVGRAFKSKPKINLELSGLEGPLRTRLVQEGN